MFARIIDEKQINQTRLLILDRNLPKEIGDNVKIDGKIFSRLDLYDLSNAVAIECPQNTNSFVGKTI